MVLLKEKDIEFEVPEGVFYNPHMSLSRELSSLIIKKLEKIEVLDAFSASGIRGIMYAKNNPKIKSIDFLDYSKRAEETIKKNLKRNEVDGEVIRDEFNSYICRTEKNYNFIELDPFGSPVPYLYNAIRHLNNNKISYISTTATDLQVLCGIQKKACKKFYQSNVMNNYFCHESALRTLIKKIIEISSEFNMNATPILSFYYRHQIKTIVKLEKNSDAAYENLLKLKYIYHDQETLETKIMESECKKCSGKLWTGKLHDDKILEKIKIQKSIKISNPAKKMIELFKEENDLPPYFYSSHKIAEKLKANPLKIERIKQLFEKAGIRFSRTHFSGEGFKTDAETSKIIEIFKKANNS